MVLDMPLADIFDEIGHDGSQIIWPDLPEPMCRRGFHPQELIDVCLARGYAATRIELSPVHDDRDRRPGTAPFPDDKLVRFTGPSSTAAA